MLICIELVLRLTILALGLAHFSNLSCGRGRLFMKDYHFADSKDGGITSNLQGVNNKVSTAECFQNNFVRGRT